MLFQPHLGRGAVDLRIGGCMSKLVKGSAFGQGSVAKRLARAYTRLKTFCKRNGKTVAIKRFSQDNLNLKSKQFPVPGHVESIFCRQLPGFLSDVFGVPKVRRIEILCKFLGIMGSFLGTGGGSWLFESCPFFLGCFLGTLLIVFVSIG